MKKISIFLLALAVASCSCGHGNDVGKIQENVPEKEVIPSMEAEVLYNHDGRGIYWWKKDFRLSRYEKDFLKEHDVKRLYVNFFDVSVEKSWDRDSDEVVPIATTRFNDTVPESVALIPVVYITIDVMRRCLKIESKEKRDGALRELAEHICDRVCAMASFNSLGPVKEIQFDCDWTGSTKDAYYALCRHAKKILSPKGIKLSGTIRLHQLKDISYPFDRGVLMVYNTGSLMNPDIRNSILNPKDVSAYAGNKKTAEKFIRAREKDCMRIDIAYPDFSWASVFRGGKFFTLLRITSCSDSTIFSHVGDNRYRVIDRGTVDGKQLQPGDIVRLDRSSMDDILKSIDIVETNYGQLLHSNIIYHLDSLNLSNFTSYEIEKIYR